MAEDGTGSEDLSPAIMRIPETWFLKKKSLRKDVPHGEKMKNAEGADYLTNPAAARVL
jgi:hypothetical protein